MTEEIAWAEAQLMEGVELMRAATKEHDRVLIIQSTMTRMRDSLPRENAILLLAVAAMLLAESERKEKGFAV